MLSVKKCFEPQQNSMAEFVELSREAIRQESLQRLDKVCRPYDIWHTGKDNLCRVPQCLSAMDFLAADAVKELNME